MFESCTFYPKLYGVVVNIWIENSDTLVEKKRDRKWSFIWVASWFLCLLSYSQGMFEYPEKQRFPSKPGPTLTALMIHDDYAIYLWFDGKWFATKIDLTYQWLELRRNTCLCENYTPLRGFPLFKWIRYFLWCSLETKCESILISFGFVNFIFVLSFLIIVFWKMLFWSVWRLILYKACL